MSDSSNFAVAWSDYRRRRRWFFSVCLGGFTVVVLLASILSKLSLGDLAFWLLGPAWIVAFGVVALRLELFRCPRCRRCFFCTLSHNNPFRRSCIHCGLPKWSESDLHEHLV